jgi:hypothetical protein
MGRGNASKWVGKVFNQRESVFLVRTHQWVGEMTACDMVYCDGAYVAPTS